MISKEKFINIMTRLEKLYKLIDDVDNVFHKLSPDFAGFHVDEAFEIPIDILEEVFKDKEQYISYFVWERNWLHNFELGDIIMDNKTIKIENWEDLYDFLIDNMEN